MKTEYKGFTISDNWAQKKVSGWSGPCPAGMNQHHIITVKFGDKLTKFDFWGSRVHPEIETDADLLDAFSCFVSDAIAGVDDFSMFCGEFGYDEYEDAGKVLKIWKACQRAKEKLMRIYPGDLWDLANELDKMNR